jgi:hypothetical protein
MPKFGQKRKDGHRFWATTRAGYENWLSPAAWENTQKGIKERAKKRERRYRKDSKFRAKVRASHRRWIHTHFRNTLLHNAKTRAKKQSARFSITLADIVVPKRCPVLGIKLVRNKGKVRFNSPTLDRIRPGRGYVKGNVLVVSQRANTIKSNATPEQILKVGKFYAKLWRSS